MNPEVPHRTPRKWADVFFDMAFMISQRSKDNSTQCGAVLVNQANVVLSTGFNGPPPQLNDEEVPWNQRPEKYAYIIHADENALLHALDSHGGKALIGSTMYLTAMPCTECVLRMIRAQVGKVYVPSCYKPYALSKYQVPFDSLLEIQCRPKLSIEVVEYVR